MKSSSLHSALTQIGDADAMRRDKPLRPAGRSSRDRQRTRRTGRSARAHRSVVATVHVRDGEIEVWGCPADWVERTSGPACLTPPSMVLSHW
jgi:hypothetical protein